MNMQQVETVVDSERGCGWRKPGGLYLRCGNAMTPCGKLPVPLTVCPCCGEGIKPARGWSWFNPQPFLKEKECAYALDADSKALHCAGCPMETAPDRAGLLWVGEKFYPTPQAYMDEARKLGISRRIPRVPNGYKAGDRVYLAHRCCIQIPGIDPDKCDCTVPEQGALVHRADCKGRIFQAGIFTTFVPERIEYVTKGDESAEDLDALVKRGITPVKVVRDVDLPPADKIDSGAEAETLAIEGGQP